MLITRSRRCCTVSLVFSVDLSPVHMHSANQFPLDVPELFLLDNLRWILYTASASSFWMDRSLLRTQSYQRRGRLSPFLWFFRTHKPYVSEYVALPIPLQHVIIATCLRFCRLIIFGRGQAVRQQTLDLPFPGSNPGARASYFSCNQHRRCPGEHWNKRWISQSRLKRGGY